MDSSVIDRYALPGLVTCAGLYQMGIFAKAVGSARIKHKVSPPETNGPPEFVRTFRAQQNSVEFYPLSVIGLWISAVYFHPVPASLAYAGYLYAKNQYFLEYSKDAQRRVKPFGLSVKFLQMLMLMSFLGVGHKTVRYYTNVDLWKVLMDVIPSLSN